MPLRAAYDGLGTLGIGADAGQAAALLATALLERGVDEADQMAAESEALAGQNLKTAIVWRIAARRGARGRGDADAERRLAGGGRDRARRPTSILDHADACVALADLRHEAGDQAGAAEPAPTPSGSTRPRGPPSPPRGCRGSRSPARLWPSTPPASAVPPVTVERTPIVENT